jgi:cyclic pyranopterin monophosphate synthase
MTQQPADEDTKNSSGFTHLDAQGRAHMVDVTTKPLTQRTAIAKCVVVTAADAPAVLWSAPGSINPVEAARVAGIQGAKRTASIIPLCHSIHIDSVVVEITVEPHRIDVSAVARINERTGVEMEALTACAIAALTLVKALIHVDPEACVNDLTLWHKSGGRSGDWHRSGPEDRLTQYTPSVD